MHDQSFFGSQNRGRRGQLANLSCLAAPKSRLNAARSVVICSRFIYEQEGLVDYYQLAAQQETLESRARHVKTLTKVLIML